MRLPANATRRHALYRAAGVRALDRAAIEGAGIPGIELMERAGAAAWHELAARWPAPRALAVLCGPGNNGGDGFVVARLAAAAGIDARVYLLGDADRVSGDAALALARWREGGGRVLAGEAPDLAGVDVVVDALFGTGLTRDLDGEALEWVRAANAAAAARVAIDIPSGLDADTGNVLGLAVRSHLTVTFIGQKQGLFTGDARDVCGEVVFADLGVGEAVYGAVEAHAWRVAAPDLCGLLGRRRRRDHKGRYGHVLVVGGNLGFPGAARLCAEAAGRSGAGLVSVATRSAHVAAIAAARPEAMARAVTDPRALAPMLDTATVVAAGPGLGRDAWAQGLLRRVVRAPAPRVLDADALNLIAEHPTLADDLGAVPTVITPHPGEAARLLGVSPSDVEADRFAAAERLVAALGCVVVLKGAGTVVSAPDETPRVVDGGNPGMASGGMGDLLTGVIAGLMAQGVAAGDAAVAGAALHAAAGDAAASRDGERGLLASDLLVHLRRGVNRL